MTELIIKIGFLDITIIDIIDILLMAFILFQLYRLVKGSLAYNIFFGFLIIYLLSLIAKALDMQLMGEVLGQFIGVGVIALLIVFQPEVRRFLLYIGRSSDMRKLDFWRRLNLTRIKRKMPESAEVISIATALQNLSKSHTGALVVFAQTSKLQWYQNTGILLNANISCELIESIFHKNSSLHDGAVIVAEHRIAAAKCVLNISDNPHLASNLGMRHRSAVGISEVSDALAIIVSEENGEISFSKEGKITLNIEEDELRKIIANALL